MDFPIVLVRFSEIALKSKRTRATLRGMLRRNILVRLRMAKLSFDGLEDTWERLILHTDESERVASALSTVFGVVSASPAVECETEISNIVGLVRDLACEKLRKGDTFAIRVRRVGKHEFTSNQVARVVGSSVVEALKDKDIEVGVDLDSPSREFFIEIRQDRSFVYDQVIAGAGGLPFGSQGKVVSLLRDHNGIIATWLMMKRGCAPIFVVFEPNREISELTDLSGSALLPYSADDLPVIGLTLSHMIKEADSPGFRRYLEYLALNEVTLLEGAEGIVTGEHLEPSGNDQIEATKIIGSIVDFPIFYPLVGFDQDSIKRLAEKIGGEKLAARTELSRQKTILGDICKVGTLNESKTTEYRETIRKMVIEARRNLLFKHSVR
jgi:thiamine biosynthesis protein ThiI